MDPQEIHDRFMHHPPTETRAVVHENARRWVRETAESFDQHLPESREKSLALTRLEEALFWANAAIARHMD